MACEAGHIRWATRLIECEVEPIATAFGVFGIDAGLDTQPYDNACNHSDRYGSTISGCFYGIGILLLVSAYRDLC